MSQQHPPPCAVCPFNSRAPVKVGKGTTDSWVTAPQMKGFGLFAFRESNEILMLFPVLQIQLHFCFTYDVSSDHSERLLGFFEVVIFSCVSTIWAFFFLQVWKYFI